MVKMNAVEGKKILVEKANGEIWNDCSDFLPENYKKFLKSTRTDSTNRFKRLRLVPRLER